MRESLCITQQELADRLGFRQSTISGIERRDDIQFSTLRKVVEGLGGRLEAKAIFPKATYRIEVGLVQPADGGEGASHVEAVRTDAGLDGEPHLACDRPAGLHRRERPIVQFRSLERHQELERSNRIARHIKERGSIFAECA